MISTVTFADVTPGPNGQYCTITYISGNYNAWNSTASSPMYGAKSSMGTDILGNTGGVPVTIQFAANCQDYQFVVAQVDSTGKVIGNYNVSPLIINNITSQGSLNVQLPSSWFTAGNEYIIYSFGVFPGLTQCPSSTAYVLMLN